MHPILKQIIDRDCHVGISNRQVMKHVISRLKHGWHTFRQMPREGRKDLLRQCAERHGQNRQEYIAVMYPNYNSIAEEN